MIVRFGVFTSVSCFTDSLEGRWYFSTLESFAACIRSFMERSIT